MTAHLPGVGAPTRASSAKRGPNPAAAVLLALLRAYRRVLSPLLPPHCRFAPSCSEYAEQAVAAYGPLRGGWLALRRLARCHPYNAGGYDPLTGVPQ